MYTLVAPLLYKIFSRAHLIYVHLPKPPGIGWNSWRHKSRRQSSCRCTWTLSVTVCVSSNVPWSYWRPVPHSRRHRRLAALPDSPPESGRDQCHSPHWRAPDPSDVCSPEFTITNLISEFTGSIWSYVTWNPLTTCPILSSDCSGSTSKLLWSSDPLPPSSSVPVCTKYSHSPGSPRTNCPRTTLKARIKSLIRRLCGNFSSRYQAKA